MNTAQKLYYAWLGRAMLFNREYKAPHAPRGTPKNRKKRYSGLTFHKLFKGHRP